MREKPYGIEGIAAKIAIPDPNNRGVQSDEFRTGQQILADMARDKMVGREYRHFKGNAYVVDQVAVHSETSELYVVYHSVSDPGKVWVRPLDMFNSKVDKAKYPDVEQELRFQPVS